ncbi:ribonuclease activity regulator RraA [Roseomonas sp. M0104]|uniref:Ribonuclease activity regulator RraA n=1 Tax=Teichococcus coralli TaxID=2545983 RepID=A0A845B803_9PROT|nr:ribonuclease activity regulator RraA [Pseudoroseomonas coralli]MXP62236.1 ribonuclease activity regulator RraA [Pseudoroseomonas coralli]
MSETNDIVITAEHLARLAKCSSGSITTELFRLGFKQCFLVGLKPLNPDVKSFAGEAFTMRMIPAREDKETYATLTPSPNPDNLQWVGVEDTQPNQVMVIDSRNDPRAASMGNMLLTRMQKRGVVGVITDGSFRDGSEIAEMDLPAYCQAVVASTRLSYHHVADLNVPIACAGVAVYPGDIVHGEKDGITVIPRHVALQVLEACERRDPLEKYLALRVQAGEALWGVYPPTEQTRADFAAWQAAGSRPEDAATIRAPKPVTAAAE